MQSGGHCISKRGTQKASTLMAKLMRNILVRRIHDRHLSRAIDRYAHGRLIDIGCGTKPYRRLIEPSVEEHIGLDHSEMLHDTTNVDLLGSAYTIPEQNDSFDTALCTAVLEHLEEPEMALRECHRVLKPGGYAIYTVPFIWHLHEEPRDFYRFSKYGLKYLFEKVGFETEELIALSGFWVTFGQLLVYYLHRFHRGPLRFLPVIPALGLIIQAGAGLLHRFDKSKQWTWMYLVVAKKPLETGMFKPAPKPAPAASRGDFGPCLNAASR